MQAVALSELIPDHQHAPSGPCDVNFTDWHALRMAENTCPDAITKYYDRWHDSDHTRLIAWAHAERALAANDINEAHRNLMSAREAINGGMQARKELTDVVVGILLLSQSLPLINERIARKLDGTGFNPETLSQHASAMALLGHSALDKVVNSNDIHKMKGKTRRNLLSRGATAVLCSLINRRQDPELVAMPTSVREDYAPSQKAAISAHEVAVISPTGKRPLIRKARPGVASIATMVGPIFQNKVAALHRNKPVFTQNPTLEGEYFHYVSSMLKREVEGSRDFNQHQAECIESLSTWLVDTVKAGTLFEQGNEKSQQ